MDKPYVPVAGSPRVVEVLRHTLRELAPAPLRRAIRAALQLPRSALHRVQRDRRIRRRLPPELRAVYLGMLAEAYARWERGETTPSGDLVALPVGRSEYRVYVRPGTSDVILYSEVVVGEQYGRISLGGVRTVVDCGANIGLTSAYLLARYPEARVIAIEPDLVNFELCRANLAQFGSRATVIQAAVWGRAIPMAVVDSPLRGSWASVSLPAERVDGAATVDGVDMATVIRRFGLEEIDILKIDVEGAEEEIFAAENLDWLDSVRCIQVEPESERSSHVFFSALRGRPFRFFQSRDAVIAVRDA